MKLLENIGNFISKYMAILVILMAGAALAAPRTFTGIAPHVSLLLGVVMFGMGMTLRGSDFRRILEHPRDVCVGVLAQFTVMPLLAWLLVMGVVICHNLLGYAVGFVLARAFHMDMAKAKAIAIEVGMQNSGLAASLAMLHFGAAAAIPGAIFSVWHNISGSLAANCLSGRQEPVTDEL